MFKKLKVVTLMLIMTFGMVFYVSARLEVSANDKPTIYTVSTSHLDTVWDWTIQETISRYLKPTFVDNMRLLDQYPEYHFNFEQAYLYMLLKEYYPDVNERLKGYIDDGRWSTVGASLVAGDTNTASAESSIRQYLYGNNFFMDEYGSRSTDVYLPDSFGFSYTLPTIANHMGLDSFMTQKLTWGSSVGIPFDMGKWEGVDGSYLTSYFNPGDYITSFDGPITERHDLLNRINRSPINKAVQLYGVGDRGGAPTQTTIRNLMNSLNNENYNIISTDTTQFAKDLTQEERDKLPTYNGELLMSTHGVGSYTSVGMSKRFNRQNELLASAAEQANVAADWLGTAVYPQEKLNEAWIRFLWHQFHDDLTGTSLAEVYTETFNDYVLSLNEFSQEYVNGVKSFIKGMDTRVNEGLAVVVHNAADTNRKDLVHATLTYDSSLPFVKVYDPNGNEVPAQVVSRDGKTTEVTFLADVLANGYKVYNVVPSSSESQLDTGLSVSMNSLENERYRVSIDNNGDIASIHDKTNNRELLKRPIQLQLLKTTPNAWPAWEINYHDIVRPAQSVVGGTPTIKILHDGPAMVSLEITRNHNNSNFTQVVTLYAGDDASRVEVDHQVQWAERATLLKANFPLTVENKEATYDLGIGTINRQNNTNKLYEVPSQQWADISKDGYGVSILTDSKYGWDKPKDNELRLSLIHTPAADRQSAHQDVLDFGDNRFKYSIMGHTGDWTNGAKQEAEKFNKPMVAFQADEHQGELGKDYSFAHVNTDQVSINAIKKAERSDEVIVRIFENHGKNTGDVLLSMGNGILSAREVNGQEEDLAAANLVNGKLKFSMGKYQIKTFALTLKDPDRTYTRDKQIALDLDYNKDVVTMQNKRDGGFGETNLSIPGELFPESILSGGVEYQFGSSAENENNAIAANGQVIPIPQGYNTAHILANSSTGDKEVKFQVGDSEQRIVVQGFRKHIGGWDQSGIGHYGYIKRENVAYASTHLHRNGRDGIYEKIYVFDYALTIPEGATSIILPNDADITIMAISLTDTSSTRVATALYDTKEKTETYELTVNNGLGSGSYPAGSVVRASIDGMVSGTVTWTGLDSIEGNHTRYVEFIMPEHDVTIEALIESYGTNYALRKPIQASSFIGIERPENMVNGRVTNMNDKWCTTEATPQWAYVDLGTPTAINRWVVKHAGAFGESTGFNTSDFRLQVSDDAVRWRTVDTVVNNTESITDREIVEITARYVRLYVSKGESGSGGAVRIYSFELYNTKTTNEEPEPVEPNIPNDDNKDDSTKPSGIPWKGIIIGLIGVVTLAGSLITTIVFNKRKKV